MTERRRLDEQLAQAQRLEAETALAGRVAHEFNNVLTVITSFATFILDDSEQDTVKEDARVILEATGRGSRLTEQLAAFSRRQVAQLETLALNDVLRATSEMVRTQMGADIELALHLQNDLWPIEADRAQIERVVVNLAVNAREAMPAGGRLLLASANVELDGTCVPAGGPAEPGMYVMLGIVDNGTGMEADTQRHAFAPLYTTKNKGKHVGLGLSTVRGIVTGSGGYLWLFSAPGVGTSVKIYWPRAEPGAGIAPTRPVPGDVSGSETILLVDNDVHVRQAARRGLEAQGYVLLEAEDARVALDHLGERGDAIDLMLTDVVLPGMSGTELAAAALRQQPALRIMFMSGYTDDTLRRHAIGDAAPVFVDKPFTSTRLLEQVRRALAPDAGA